MILFYCGDHFKLKSNIKNKRECDKYKFKLEWLMYDTKNNLFCFINIA